MYQQIASNKAKTWLIMFMFVVLIGVLAVVFGLIFDDMNLIAPVIIGAVIYALIQYFIGGRLALSASGAHEIARADNPRLFHVVENLTITTGLPMPKIYLINDSAPNAFATGHSPQTASVAATTGLLELMDDRELTAVMAHEMAHIGNFDIRVSLVAYGLTVAITFLANAILRSSPRSNNRDSNGLALIIGLVAAVLAPVVATLIQMAVSRNREYLADSTAALTTRDPESLASALAKLQADTQQIKRSSPSMANMYIKNPLKPGLFSRLFSTHPPIEERISRLGAMVDRF